MSFQAPATAFLNKLASDAQAQYLPFSTTSERPPVLSWILLGLVVAIIYVVNHISDINATLMASVAPVTVTAAVMGVANVKKKTRRNPG